MEHLIGQRIYRVLENGACERYPRWIEAIDSASLLVVSARGTLDIVPIETVGSQELSIVCNGPLICEC